jgi:hypothetical protein
MPRASRRHCCWPTWFDPAAFDFLTALDGHYRLMRNIDIKPLHIPDNARIEITPKFGVFGLHLKRIHEAIGYTLPTLGPGLYKARQLCGSYWYQVKPHNRTKAGRCVRYLVDKGHYPYLCLSHDPHNGLLYSYGPFLDELPPASPPLPPFAGPMRIRTSI